jgi:hypothetical protein
MASQTLLSHLAKTYADLFGQKSDVGAFVAWAEATLAANAPVGTGFSDDSGAITVRLQSGDQYALCRNSAAAVSSFPSVPITGQADRKGGAVPSTDRPITGG